MNQSLCRHVDLGRELSRRRCNTCRGKVRVKIFHCDLYGRCTLQKQLEGIACCHESCTDHEPRQG